MKIVYFAGKVEKGGGYREKLFKNPKVMSSGYASYKVGNGQLIYGGPFALTCDHGCCHSGGTHGLTSARCGCGSAKDLFGVSDYVEPLEGGLTRRQAVSKCLQQLFDCDAVHCYFEKVTCYGTLFELGVAAALGIPVYIYYKKGAHNWNKDFWFAMNGPNVKHCGPGTETSIHPDLLIEEKPYGGPSLEHFQPPKGSWLN